MNFAARFLTLLVAISISGLALAQSTSGHTADFSAAYGNRYWQSQHWNNGALVATRIRPQDETGKATYAGHPPLSKGDNPDRWDTFGYVDSSGVMKRGDAVAVYDENGRMIKAAHVSVPGNAPFSISAATFTPDGAIVVAGGWQNQGKGPTNFIGVADSSGNVSPNSTALFVPTKLCSSSSNSVWAYGWERSPEYWGRQAKSFLMLREFSLDGKELRSMLNRSDFPVNLYGNPQELVLQCTSNSVVMFFAVTGQLFVLDTASGKLSTWQAPPLVWKKSPTMGGFAVTSSGEVFSNQYEKDINRLFRFERKGSKGEWVPLDSDSAKLNGETLIGAAGDDLILLKFPGFTARWLHVQP